MTAIPFGIASGSYVRRFETSAEAKEWYDNLAPDDPYFETPLAHSSLFTIHDLKRQIDRYVEAEEVSA